MPRLSSFRPPPRPRGRPAPPAPPTPPEAVPESGAGPAVHGTALMLTGFVLTYLLSNADTPVTVARFAAIGMLLSIGVSVYCDLKRGLHNLFRTDLVAIIALYFFTFFEFLFPQYALDGMVSTEAAQGAVVACMIGFAGLAVGRHCSFVPTAGIQKLCRTEVSRHWLIALFWTLFVLGNLNVLIAVDFNLKDIYYWLLEPRFSAPWGRGRLGDWKALLHELGMLLYLIPPFAGIIMARRRHYSWLQIVPVALAVLYVLAFSFCEGTRYIFSSYLVTFVVGYCFACDRRRLWEIFVVSGIGLGILWVSTSLMLNFRSNGLRAYLEGLSDPQRSETGMGYVFVDYNLHTIARLVEAIPTHHRYLGWEVPYLAIVRPIPRALWPGKPEGMSFSTEDLVGAEGWTVAATFIGEAYMSGGLVVVALVALALGIFTGWWNRIGSSHNSDFGILIYASGFFASAMTMRSLQVLTTAMLPTTAAIGILFLIVRYVRGRQERMARRQLTPPRRHSAPA